MASKVYVVTDLGPGDGGKGTVVHKIATMMRAHTVIKRGGAQGSHGVQTSGGDKFAFSQWGCGTLEGIPTHLSAQMVIAPERLLIEADSLRYQCGIYDAFSLLTVDEEALCATPFHGIASRINELARGDNPRGTVGTGVGEAYREYRRRPTDAIKARDLTSSDLRERLRCVRERIQADLQYTIEFEFLKEDRATLAEEVSLLYDDRFLDFVVSKFEMAGKLVNVVSRDYLGGAILPREGVAIVESSHGVLTDRVMGFHPHTSAIRTLPSFTHGLLQDAGHTGEIINIGVTRSYAVRHGAGPMPTADPKDADLLLPSSHKDNNRYQGQVRVGPLDFVLLRYALAACGGPDAFDGLAMTWFDQIQANGSWKQCRRYRGAKDAEFFLPNGDIRVVSNPSPQHQFALGQQLSKCHPEVMATPVMANVSQEVLFDFCAEVVQAQAGVPVRMVSFGPTELDQICK